MFQDKYVFAQLTAFLNRTQFNNYVRKYDGNRYVKHFTCRNQLLAMMFGQVSNRESLRDLIVALEAHRAKQYHLGLGRNTIVKATLAYANQTRDYRIFEDFAFYMMKEACKKRETNILNIPGKKYAFDSTTIPLCLATFPWAKFRSKKGGVKAHVLYGIEAQAPAFYTVTTASKHDSTAMSSIPYEPNSYYISDRAYDTFKKLYKIHLTGSYLCSLSQIELEMQDGKMEAKNAVRIQISVTIITYCLVAIVHHDMQLKRSTYEVLQILSISLTDKTHLRDLFDKTIFNDVKELDFPLFKGLFD